MLKLSSANAFSMGKAQILSSGSVLDIQQCNTIPADFGVLWPPEPADGVLLMDLLPFFIGVLDGPQLLLRLAFTDWLTSPSVGFCGCRRFA